MKKAGKPISVIFILLILAFTYFAVFGAENYFGTKRLIYFKNIQDIRLGMDVGGGSKTVFTPDVDDINTITADQLSSIKQKLQTRMENLRITDYDIAVDDESKQLTMRHQNYLDESVANQTIYLNVGKIGLVQICQGSTSNNVIADADKDIKRADVMYDAVNGYYVQIVMTSEGADRLEAASLQNSSLSVWLDGTNVANASQMSDNKYVLNMSGDFEACLLAGIINSGSLPFELTYGNTSAIEATAGSNVLLTLGISAGVLMLAAFVLLIAKYRLPGVVSSIVLVGQAAGLIAVMTGFFSPIYSVTATLPVIAAVGISMLLCIGTSVVTANNIKTEINSDHTIDGAISTGFAKTLPWLISSSAALLLISVVIMGAFGYGHSFTARIFSNIFFFSQPVEGNIYYFGYILFGGVLFNLFMNGIAARVILRGLARFKALRRPSLYGGAKND